MTTTTANILDPTTSPNWRLWLGRGLTLVASAFLLLSAVFKLAQSPQMVTGLHEQLGYTLTAITVFGLLEIAIVALYLTPPTAVLGAILMTGYLGGAISAHVRGGQPVYFPLAVAVIGWAGLYLRNRKLSALIPLQR